MPKHKHRWTKSLACPGLEFCAGCEEFCDPKRGRNWIRVIPYHERVVGREKKLREAVAAAKAGKP